VVIFEPLLLRIMLTAPVSPNLQQIVVAGHSAGAQVAQRWAAVSTLSTQTPLLTWVANPDSLLWLSADRPLDTSTCATYDYWKEGLSN